MILQQSRGQSCIKPFMGTSPKLSKYLGAFRALFMLKLPRLPHSATALALQACQCGSNRRRHFARLHRHGRSMRLSGFAALFFIIVPALAEDAPVPLPRPRPPEATRPVPLPVEIDRLEREAALRLCEEFTRADVAVSTALAPMAWDNGCTAAAPVSVTAIKLEGGKLVELKPAATLRCPTALIIARWFREDLEPLAERLGSPINRVEVASSFACRPRNSISGAIMSEHGKANALDIWALHLADGRRIGIEHSD